MKIGIYWFRKALRLHDNPTLLRACNECDIVYPLFFLDPTFTTRPTNNNNNNNHNHNEQTQAPTMHCTGASLPSPNVFKFFFETLSDLNKSLSSNTFKSQLLIIRGKPINLYPFILKNLKITDLYFETDTEPYAIQRDNAIIHLCNKNKINIHQDNGHTLYPPEYLINVVQNKMNKPIPKTYRAFINVLSKAGDPAKPLDPPKKIPGGDHTKKLSKNKAFIAEITKISEMNQYEFKCPQISELPYTENEEKEESKKVNEYEIDDGEEYKYMKFIGGEKNALKTMKKYLAKKKWICSFEKPKTSPNSLQASTTTLSMYITTGSLSSRLFWHEIDKIYKESKSGYAKPPTSLHGQLYFREWFYLLSYVTPNFHQMNGNPICKQINWDNYDDTKVMKWKLGQTGYPFIDALMIQLRRTGWMHHLGRHAVACFFTRGDLWQSWEIGRDIFGEYLLDGDYALNAANWMWLSASAFFTAYFRVYSPIAFGKKTDKNGDFIKFWIPKLKKYPTKYIYEPWKAPKELQKQWGCVIGKDYPMPMVDHDVVKKENLEKMKKAFDAHKKSQGNKNKGNGNNKKVKAKVIGKKRKWSEMS